MDKLIYILFVFIGGAASAVQAPINAGLGKRIGVLETGLWSFSTGMALLLILTLFLGKGQFGAVLTAPKWQLLGGILGVIAVCSMIVAAPQLGIGLAMVCIIFGQVLIAIVIDSLGLFGTETVPLDYNRIIGVLLMFVGIIFVYRSKMGV